MKRYVVAAVCAALGLQSAWATPAATGAQGDLPRLLERARLAQARASQPELARLNEDIAVRVLGQLSLGRTDGLAAFARAVETAGPRTRRAYAPAWARIQAGLLDPAVKRAAAGGGAGALAGLEARVERALGSGGPQVTAVAVAPARAAAPGRVPVVDAPSPFARTSPTPATVYVPEDAPGVAGPRGTAQVQSWSFVPAGAPTLVVADFTERGYRTAASLAAADLLARALADTGRFKVLRAAGAAGGGGYLIDADISGIRVFARPSLGYYGGYGFGSYGFGRRGRSSRRYLYPYNYSNDIQYTLDARVRVTDLASHRALAERSVAGTTTEFYPGGYYGFGPGYGGGYLSSAGGPAAQVLDQAMLDKRQGALRFVLDALPVQGRVARVDDPRTAVIEVPSARSVRQNDRFVVLGPGGQEGAILRARDVLSDTQVRVSVSGKDDDDPPPPVRAGEAVVSRGF